MLSRKNKLCSTAIQYQFYETECWTISLQMNILEATDLVLPTNARNIMGRICD